MRRIEPIAEDAETVTLTRADFEALLDAAEDGADLAVFHARRAREAELGKDEARAGDVPPEVVERLLRRASGGREDVA